jgi:CO/xanthine dehydrogenase Mo-binding subunit
MKTMTLHPTTPGGDSSSSTTASTTLTRRAFVQIGGALFVSLGLPVGLSAARAAGADSGAGLGLGGQTPPADAPQIATQIASWIEIRNDNTILVRTGRTEIGTGMSAFYAQTVAEELRVQPDAITLLMGDTDQTPDGGYSAGFLSGATNLRKVAAYTYQALLALAATKLGVAASDLRVTDAIVSGGGKTVSYGQLVQGQQLDLKIPVTGKATRMDPAGNGVAGLEWAGLDGFAVAGDPPMKPISEYTVIGTSHPMPGIPDKVTGKTQWSCDVTLPGMLHARMLRPTAIGSTLIAVGKLDKRQFPTAEVVRKGNLVAVVSPDEWEATGAAQAVAAGTKWTAGTGLPGSENLTRTLRAHKWGKPESRGNAAAVTAALAGAPKTISVSYEQPYVRHAPIGPFLAVADVRGDGTVTVWSHSANSQGLRARIAHLLGTPTEKVVVRWLDHAGQFGRTTFGGDGAEADAVILSQITGKPVRVQWTLQDDLAWSSASPGWVSDIKAALDTNGRLTAVHSAYYSATMFDARPLGAILAGMPSGAVKPDAFVATEWPYDKIEQRLEQGYAMPSLGANPSTGGLRGLIMRTPGQRQQNFVLESLINEAAAAAGADPVAFRLQHTTSPRLIEIINATTKAAGWEPRPSPHAGARRTGTDPITGHGFSIIVRSNGYWAGVAEITVNPSTGAIQVTKFTIGADCGKIINPRQLDRVMRSGVVMGLSEALKEEVTFDRTKVTSTDWSSYRILTMQETPEIKVVQISRDDHGFGGGSEAANALGPAAVAAAFFDATGVQPRRIPLTPAYVKTLLQTRPRA